MILTEPRILFIDIEWKPALAYVWKLWDVNIAANQIKDPGGLLCFCAQWQGSKDYIFLSEWEDGRDVMARALLQLLNEADAVVHYNGDKYDMPKITGEILLAGLPPPPQVASIDCLKTVKKFGYLMNRLGYITELLNIGSKVDTGGFELWRGVIDGDPKAQAKMKRYNIKDVKVLAQLYQRILPFIRNHPHLRDTPKESCPSCSSTKVQARGFRRTKSFKIQRHQCTDCGSWFDGVRQKV